MSKKRFGFTLIELLVVLVIIGILSTILVRTYITVGTISFRAQQQKNIYEEMLFVSQTLQNFADRNTIDYTQYAQDELYTTKGITDTLYLSGEDGQFALTTSGDCKEKCVFVIKKTDKTIVLSDAKKIALSKIHFKIIPRYSSEQYLSTGAICDTQTIACLSRPGFWIMGTAYPAQYSKDRHRDIKIPIRQFFSL